MGVYVFAGLLTLLIANSVGLPAEASLSAAMPQCVSVTTLPAAQQVAANIRQMSADAAELSFMQNTVGMDAGAIRMSEQAAARATHPELRRFAQRLVNERTGEQERLLVWILAIYGDGTYSASKLLCEDSRTIARFDQCTYGFEVGYMLAMIAHDAGVLAVADEAQHRSAHGRIARAALRIASKRSADVAQLKTWLACWYGIRVSIAGSQRIQC